MKKIMLYGIGSYKNKGCEAIARSTYEQLKNKYDSFCIASYDFYSNKKYFNDDGKIKYINHYRLLDDMTETNKKKFYKMTESDSSRYNFEKLYQSDVIKSINDYELFISGGGDNYSYNNNVWLDALNDEIKKKNKKMVLWGASIFETIENMQLIKELDKYDLILLRESLSYNALKKYISEDKLMLLPDPAFSLKAKTVSLPFNEKFSKNGVIGFNVSPMTINYHNKDSKDYISIIDSIKYILNNTKYSVLLLPHVLVPDSNDLDVLKLVYESFSDNDRVMLLEKDYNCEEIKYVISKLDILIAARTHASIAAYSTCVPTLVIGYSVKSKGIAKDLFSDVDNYVIGKESLNSKILIEKIQYIINNKEKIRKHLKTIMPKIISSSKNMFDEVIKKLSLESKICSKYDCTGCTACLNVCPVGAIKMEIDNEGFSTPKINKEKCINCGKCSKTCPILTEKYKSINLKDSKCYVGYSKDEANVINSSSGGIFGELATHVLNKNGIVYGVKFEKNSALHVRISKKEDLEQIKKSKYVQSNLNNIFKTVKKDLEARKLVLFSGTGCQVAGLKSYLCKNYENLICVSMICHGVSNQKVLEKQIAEIEKVYSEKVTTIDFRCKDFTWENPDICYYLTNNRKVIRNFNSDSYMNLFLKNHTLRKSCYNCNFRSSNPADIVLADFWNSEKNIKTNKMGHSAIILKTQKGEKIFNDINDKLYFEEIDIKKIEKGNPCLTKSLELPDNRYYVFGNLSGTSIKTLNDFVNFYESFSKTKEEYENYKKVSKDTLDNTIQEMNSII